MRDPCVLFLNIEPDTTGFLPLDLRDLYSRARSQMTVCVEITERALTRRPASLLAHVADMRAMGVAVALDDVGTDAETLAMMSLLEPEVIKLDLALVQGSPDAEIAEVVHAVAAQAERTGARVLVEGVETEAHARTGDALGATLAQGWLYGRRETEIVLPEPPGEPVVHTGRHADPRDTATFALAEGCGPRRPPRERAATAGDDTAPRGPGQGARPHRRARRRVRPARAAPHRRAARALRLARQPARLLRDRRRRPPKPSRSGRPRRPDRSGEPPIGEWTVAVVAPHFAAALVAHARREPVRTARRSTTTCSRTTRVRDRRRRRAMTAPASPSSAPSAI